MFRQSTIKASLTTRAARFLTAKAAFARTLVALGLAICLSSSNAMLLAQTGGQALSRQGLSVSAEFSINQPVAPDSMIALRLNRSLEPQDGRIAIFLGQVDLTALFSSAGTVMTYDPKNMPLAAGETEVIVYLVSPDNDWREIARFPLRVSDPAREAVAEAKPPEAIVAAAGQDQSVAQPTDTTQAQPAAKPNRSGFEKMNFIPSITLGMKSQPGESHFPDSTRPQRPTFTDFTVQGSFKTEIARDFFNSQTQFDLVGSSFRQEALRFGQLGDDAPRIDLSSYLMQFQTGKARYLVGHTSYGTNRHLINSFSSRGVTVTVPITARYDFSLAAMNGTSIVGVDNFFGLAKRRHQVLSGTLGVEIFPARPGGLRVEAGLFDGWLQPLSSVNQGNVNDAERSRGLGLRVVASDAAGRLRLDTGFSRSQFISPEDQLVSQGNALVLFPAVTRNARYLDLSYDALKNFQITKEKQATLNFTFRHERVDPLYRSLGASTQADKASNELVVASTIGEVTAQFSHFRFNDNLAGIPSVLKSLTRANRLLLSAPATAIFNIPADTSKWLPRLSYNIDRLHQFGDRIPVGGGFELDPSAVPDQLATNQAFSADWQFEKIRVAYRLNHSFQNNQQPEREQADFINLINGFSLGITPLPALDLNFELSNESANNKESARIDRTLRFGSNINWRMTASAALSANLSTAIAGDDGRINRNRNTELDLQWTYRFGVERDRFRKMQSQFFARYANRFARSRDSRLLLNDVTKLQTFNLGLSFTFF